MSDVQAEKEGIEREQVPAWPRWVWDCEACGSTVETEHAPPEDEECDVCGHKVRTDAR